MQTIPTIGLDIAKSVFRRKPKLTGLTGNLSNQYFRS